MNKKVPKVISEVVNNDMCIGCGICSYICPSKALKMEWNSEGFLVPVQVNTCNEDNLCIKVCPFNPLPEKAVKTENELSALLYEPAQRNHLKIGNYINSYTGFSNEYRLTSSSGGIATYVLQKLLENKIVDFIVSVKQSNKSNFLFEYSIIKSTNELRSASRTRYYPVNLDTVLPEIDKLNGRVAIVGVGCFIKAIRLAQYYQPSLREKIPFLVGIICGGIKSKFFTEYLANKVGVNEDQIVRPEYRIKDLKSTAGDYAFSCFEKQTNTEKTIKMISVGDMWGTGMFKANACDFCDDVTTELADISLGDAWIHPYNKDGRGTNIIITRTLIADELIMNGNYKGNIKVEKLPLKLLLRSQQGSFNHRHDGLKYRINCAQKKGVKIPPKRFDKVNIYADYYIVQFLRLRSRRISIKLWKEEKNAVSFDRKIHPLMFTLKLATIFNHFLKKWRN